MKTKSIGEQHTENLFTKFVPPTQTTKPALMKKMNCKEQKPAKVKTMACKKLK